MNAMKRNYIIETTYEKNGKLRSLKPVVRKTEKAISRYANEMYRKYGESVTVEVGYFNDDLKWVRKETWHA